MSEPASAADRNLVVGLLALRLDYVNSEQLLHALGSNPDAVGLSIGETLCGKGVLNEDDRRDLERLADWHLSRHNGDAQASLAALRIEPAVREQLARLSDPAVQASLSLLSPEPANHCTNMPTLVGSSATSRDLAQAGSPTASPVRYRRQRPHARGGLGEVFVAVDQELRREVALKEIQLRHADHPDSRARFVLEAEITGNLEHPGIIPVYGLGTYADGRPYYAMRFIKGDSLEEKIRRFHEADRPGREPSERAMALRSLLRRFVDVCNAVAYAHSRGVIHRDLKPANVMVGEFGETLVVDWGLAKVQKSSEPTEGIPPALSENVTATVMGSAVGTPGYLPPEQAAGHHDQVTVASDVYSLGATLYHLLTGKPPFNGSDVDELLKRVIRGDYPPARQVNSAVPAALEAVCRKAMAVEPSERYQSARALAEEVERWLADEPVKAYREPLTMQMRRWARRRRTLVSVAAALLLASVVALGVGLWLVNQERAQTAIQRDRAVLAEEQERERRTEAEKNLARALKAEKQAKANLQLAQDNLKLARYAIDDCFNIARENPVFQQPRMEQARKILLAKTLPFYRNFLVQRPDDRALQTEEAELWLRVGFIEHVLMRGQAARQAYERAREKLQALVKAHPDVPGYQHNLAGTHSTLGDLLRLMGKREEALEEHRQARDLQRKLVQAHPNRPSYQQGLAITHRNTGTLLYHMGKLDDALEEHRQARDLQRKLVQAHPDLPAYQQDLASTHSQFGKVLHSLGKREEALVEYRQARDLQQKLVQAHPNPPEYQDSLGYTHHNLGNLLSEMGKNKEALVGYRQARELRQKLVNTHPDLPRYQHDLSTTHNSLGFVLRALGQREEALEEYGRARDLRKKLVQAHPDLPQYQDALARTHHDLALLLTQLGKPEQAVKEYEQARDLQQQLVKAHPAVPEFGLRLAVTCCNLGRLLLVLGKARESLCHNALAIEVLQATPQRPQDQARARLVLRNGHWGRAEALTVLGRHREAIADWHQAVRLAAGKDRFLFRVNRVLCLAAAGDYRQSATEAEELARAKGIPGETCYNLACSFALNVGTASRDVSRPLPEREKNAEAWARQALALLERACQGGYFKNPKVFAQLKKDTDLDFLRSRDDFRNWLKQLQGSEKVP
jgi:serine/threonine-protein kinase